jgi:hypothetical protein
MPCWADRSFLNEHWYNDKRVEGFPHFFLRVVTNPEHCAGVPLAWISNNALLVIGKQRGLHVCRRAKLSGFA